MGFQIQAHTSLDRREPMMLVGNQNSLVPQPDVVAVAVGCREEGFEKVLRRHPGW